MQCRVNPSFQDIATNYVWLKPLVTFFPQAVPGATLLTDIWVYVDGLLGEKMLVKEGDSKRNQAADETERCKKLMGALRYLYRNSCWVVLS